MAPSLLSFFKRRSTNPPVVAAPEQPPAPISAIATAAEDNESTDFVVYTDDISFADFVVRPDTPRAHSPSPSVSSSGQSSPDALLPEYALRRRGLRSVSPYPFARTLSRRNEGSPDSALSSSYDSDKENIPPVQPFPPSPTPSPKKGSSGAEVARGRSLARKEGSKYSRYPSSEMEVPFEEQIDEIEIMCRGMTLSRAPLADVTSAYTSELSDTTDDD